MQGIFDWRYILPKDMINLQLAVVGLDVKKGGQRVLWSLPSSGDIVHKARQPGAV